MKWSVREIAEAVGGQILDSKVDGSGAGDSDTGGGEVGSSSVRGGEAGASSEVMADGVSIDSRTIQAGQLFVPIVADNDGHDHIASAIQAGAAAYLTSRMSVSQEPTSQVSTMLEPTTTERKPPAILVADTAKALTDLAKAARSSTAQKVAGKAAPKVIAITGSVGKTTSKDFCAATLASKFRCHASQKSFNNELGVPLTILNAPDDCEVIVAEMGASKVGDIASLCEIARPHIGVLTAIAVAHTLSFGTIEHIAKAKGELLEALPEDGVAVLNHDDLRVMAQAGRSAADEIITFGTSEGADVRADQVLTDDLLRPSFELLSPWGSEEVRLKVSGRHNVGNALAAATVALRLGMAISEVAEALSVAEISPWRMSLSKSERGVIVLNDAYNANPTSMKAALQSLAQLPAKRRFAVLGTMAELGELHDSSHQEIAELAEQLGVMAIAVAETAYGLENLPDAEAAYVRLCELAGGESAAGELEDGDAVLVKGSRVAGLEALAERLLR